MLEKHLYRAINKLVPKAVHRQSMTGASMTANGTPDFYYDGDRNDLWVEYKMLRAMPRSGIVIGAYTALQLDWMERRYMHSWQRNMIGIVGLPNRTAVIQHSPKEWREGSPITNAVPIQEVALWITDFCSQSSAVSAVSSSASRR